MILKRQGQGLWHGRLARVDGSDPEAEGGAYVEFNVWATPASLNRVLESGLRTPHEGARQQLRVLYRVAACPRARSPP